jgi:hypothetical protein
MAKRMGRRYTRMVRAEALALVAQNPSWDILQQLVRIYQTQSTEHLPKAEAERDKLWREAVATVERTRTRQQARHKRRLISRTLRGSERIAAALDTPEPVAYPAEVHTYIPDGKCVRFVSIYDESQEYGGPEEGGWWYDYRQRHISVPVRNAAHAARIAAKLAHRYGTNWKRHERGSVLHRGEHVVRYEHKRGEHERLYARYE